MRLFTLTSDLHGELAKNAHNEQFIKDIEAAVGQAFDYRETDYSDYGAVGDIIYVRTGGTEAIFKEVFAGHEGARVRLDKVKEEKKNEINKKTETETEKEKNEKKRKDSIKIKEEKKGDYKEKKDEVKKKNKKEKHEQHILKVITSVKKNYEENKEDKEDGEKTFLINKKEIFQKYMSLLIVSYTDFKPHIEQFLTTDDFNWETNAKYFFSDYAGKEMDYLNTEFKNLENLSSKDIQDDVKINIFNLREAIEKYLTLIFGIKNEDYNYHNNNLSMSVELKTIIKKIACYPELIKEQELNNCLEILNKKELVYLILIVTSIKQKISLTFFAKAFDDFTSNNS